MELPEVLRMPVRALCVATLLASAVPGLFAAESAPFRTDGTLEPARSAIRTKDFAGAMGDLERLAQGGNANASFLLATLWLTNPQAEPDPARARPLLQRAADAGVPQAAYMLAVLAATAVPADDLAARRWLERAAAGGLASARELQGAERLPLRHVPERDLESGPARGEALLRAARQDDLVTLQRLSAVAAPARVADEFGRTALAVAASADAGRAVTWLLQAGLAPQSADRHGITPLMLAAAAPRGDAIPLLLAAGAEVNAVDAVGNTALHYASARADAERIERLLQAGAHPNALNADGERPLDIAMRLEDPASIKSMRAAGAETSRPATIHSAALDSVQRSDGQPDAYAGRSDLEVAASRRDAGLLQRLLSRGTATPAQKNAALIAAVDADSAAAVAALLAAGADASAADARQRTAASIAATHDQQAILLQILETDGSTRGRGSGNARVLLDAAAAGAWSAVAMLLKHGAAVDVSDAQGRDALMIASAANDVPGVELLLANGASHTRLDRAGRDALLHAALAGASGAMQKLLDAGARPTISGADGVTALGAAAARGMAESIAALIAAGANPNAVSRGGTTPLMQAAVANQVQTANALLRAGAKVDLRDSRGDTALTLAVREASPDVVRALLVAGADRDLRNDYRVNARDIAESLHLEDMRRLLASK